VPDERPNRRLADRGRQDSPAQRQRHIALVIAADPVLVSWLAGQRARALDDAAHLLDLAGQDKAAAIVRREAVRHRNGT
jgi:hypothetical protein